MLCCAGEDNRLDQQADGRPPRVSVIMATYNGSRYIVASVASVLAQVMPDFELIVTDDCSTDGTADILAGMGDPRIRVLRNTANLGVVGSRNRCFAAARGRYVAMLDHDDLSRPLRLGHQADYLDANPGTVLVGTAAHTMTGGVLSPTRHPAHTTPALVRWLLHIDNPLICSSVMMRPEAVRRLGTFMREDMIYADDYDLYHRLLQLGDVARLDESLTIYRLHASNTFRAHEERMTGNAVKALTPSYVRWFGDGAEAAAALVVRHSLSGQPVPDLPTLAALRGILVRLQDGFLADFPMDDADRRAVAAATDSLWRRVLQVSAANGRFRVHPGRNAAVFRPPSGAEWGLADWAHLGLAQLPGRRPAAGYARRVLDRRPTPPPRTDGTLFARAYHPIPTSADGPPTLYVVVDTEAEFDWGKSFDKSLVSVTAMSEIGRGQAVFDRYGLRPIYVVDYPIATQEFSAGPLRAILHRDGCAIGAHLHPWTTPPLTEEASVRNSYPGNLPPDLESQKLQVLVGAIRDSFGITPHFYKAGRYGLGSATPGLLAELGFKVDLSVLPGTDLRATSGPDFSGIGSGPYRADGVDHLTLPVTRACIGLLPSLRHLDGAIQAVPGLRWLHLQPALSRLRLSDTITLTPEGVTAAEQIRLVRAMLRQGHRIFVLHYHSPSLSPGHTPYVRSPADADEFVRRIERVCGFFFDELGGMPGYPQDLCRMADQLVAA